MDLEESPNDSPGTNFQDVFKSEAVKVIEELKSAIKIKNKGCSFMLKSGLIQIDENESAIVQILTETTDIENLERAKLENKY